MRILCVWYPGRRMTALVAVGVLSVFVETGRAADRFFPGVAFSHRNWSSDYQIAWYGGT